MRLSFLIIPVFCVFFVDTVSAQERSSTVPVGSPIPCHSRSFSIPFAVHSDGVVDPPKEVELLYSSDRGSHWFSVKRVPVDTKKFDFVASEDGEYWFVFRTITLSGLIKATNQSGPQLRVLVDTSQQNSATPTDSPPTTTSKRPESTVPPTNTLRSSDDSVSKTLKEPSVVAVTPPKPPRQRQSETTAKQPPVADESVNPKNSHSPPMLFSPFGEAAPSQQHMETTEKKRSAIDPLLAEMSRFYDTPLTNSMSRTTNDESRITNHEPRIISGVSLADLQQKPRVVVRWNIGDASWRKAHADILRGISPQGPWVPIATNLPNNGEYWWFVTSTDFKPFYVSVRLRTPSGISTTDATRSLIRIDPALFNSTAVTALR